MNAQQIVRVMNDIKPDMFRIERGIMPENKPIFGKIDPKELEELKAWKEEDYGWPDMTSNDYFRICDWTGIRRRHLISS